MNGSNIIHILYFFMIYHDLQSIQDLYKDSKQLVDPTSSHIHKHHECLQKSDDTFNHARCYSDHLLETLVKAFFTSNLGSTTANLGSLPETNSSHPKMDGWNTILFFSDGLF